MSDSDLIERVAEMWVASGGDKEGFLWSHSKLLDAIEKKRIEISESLARKRAKILEAIDE